MDAYSFYLNPEFHPQRSRTDSSVRPQLASLHASSAVPLASVLLDPWGKSVFEYCPPTEGHFMRALEQVRLEQACRDWASGPEACLGAVKHKTILGQQLYAVALAYLRAYDEWAEQAMPAQRFLWCVKEHASGRLRCRTKGDKARLSAVIAKRQEQWRRTVYDAIMEAVYGAVLDCADAASVMKQVKGLDATRNDIRCAAQYFADKCVAMRLAAERGRLAGSGAECCAAAMIQEARVLLPLLPEFTQRHVDARVVAKRLCCPKWWRRKLSSLIRGRRGEIWRRLCHLGWAPWSALEYTSLDAVRDSAWQDAERGAWMRRMELVDASGLVRPMTALGSLGRARYAEMMARAAGMAEVARRRGWQARFITITLPARFHPKTRQWPGGNEVLMLNPRWDPVNGTVKNGLALLTKRWGAFRSEVCRRKLQWMWFANMEPDATGTPHMHLVAFASKEDWEWLEDRLDFHFRRASGLDGEEPGAEEHRVKIDRWQEGDSIGIAVHYMFQAIRGSDPSSPSKGSAKGKQSSRTRAWAREHGVRQIRMSRTHATVWRALRAAPECPPPLADLKDAAMAGDYGSFLWALAADGSGQTAHRGQRSTGVKLRYAPALGAHRRRRLVGLEYDGGVLMLKPRVQCRPRPTESVRAPAYAEAEVVAVPDQPRRLPKRQKAGCATVSVEGTKGTMLLVDSNEAGDDQFVQPNRSAAARSEQGDGEPESRDRRCRQCSPPAEPRPGKCLHV